MTSDHGKQKLVFRPKAKGRSARLRRLEIRKTKSYLRKESELGGPLAYPDSEWRNSALEKVATSTTTSTVHGTDEGRKVAKFKGIDGNMSDGINFPNFSDDGQMKGKGKIGDEESSEKLVARLVCGSVSLMGRRRKMEDAVTVAPESIAGEYSFFAVYDGHGGDCVSNACREKLHKLIENDVN